MRKKRILGGIMKRVIKRFMMGIFYLSLIVAGVFLLGYLMNEKAYGDQVTLGQQLMEEGHYEEGIEAFNDAIMIIPEKEEAKYYLAQAHLKIGADEEALAYIRECLTTNRAKNTKEEYMLKGEILMYLGDTKGATGSFRQADINNGSPVAIDYIQSINYLEMTDVDFKYYALTYDLYDYSNELLAILDHRIETYPNSNMSYHVKGLVLGNQEDYYGAITFLKKAFDLEASSDTVNKLIDAYYMTDRINYCEEMIAFSQDTFGDSDYSSYYEALCFKKRTHYEESIEILEALVERADDSYIVDIGELRYQLADSYYMIEDYDKVESCLSQYEYKGNEIDGYVYVLINNIKMLQSATNDATYIKLLFVDNYLYDIDLSLVQDILGDLTDEEAAELFDEIKQGDDDYTYFVCGDSYNDYQKSESNFSYTELDKNTHLIDIGAFNSTVHLDVINVLEGISNTKEATLIIDLRDNLGGNTSSLRRIMDNLVGEVTMYTISSSKIGKIKNESDSFMIEFKEIIVLVNDMSASSSEILALGLSEHLDNVTIIGEQTYGKGVGQFVFDNELKNRLFAVVAFEWTVNDISIHEVGVTPDVVIDDELIAAYMLDTYGLDGLE